MKLVTIFTTFNLAEADLIASKLDAAGFDVALPDEFASQILGSSGAFFGEIVSRGGVRVQVPEDQAAEARALLDSTITSQNPPQPSEEPSSLNS